MGDWELLVVIIKETRFLDDVLTGFMDLGITGATVVDSRGMGQILSSEVPIFSGLRDLMPGANVGSHVILSVIKQGQVGSAVELVSEVCGRFEEEGAGVVFTLPVNNFVSYRCGG